MHRYKPSKIPLFIFWAILAVILFLIRYAVNLIEKLIPFSVNYILMPTSAIKSVTTIITPLGSITGLNFVVLNALGARLLIPFMSRRDAMEISAIVNSSIRNRERKED